MKKTFFAIAAFFTIGLAAKAQDTSTRVITRTHRTTTTTHTRTTGTPYYYYPDANVYYNEKTGDYYYYDEPATTWTTSRILPAYLVVDKKPRYTVYYNGNDVYTQNTEHLKKYKVKKNGKVKAKH
ncbi:MAG: hypothetical protein JWP88_706 [Flaviaesturariibacter sp.]|nr:hypothetical protein [Flaviaesturariibacter sp.]